VDDPEARGFHEAEPLRGWWTVRPLYCQVSSQLDEA
jgi:hypothetical protein